MNDKAGTKIAILAVLDDEYILLDKKDPRYGSQLQIPTGVIGEDEDEMGAINRILERDTSYLPASSPILLEYSYESGDDATCYYLLTQIEKVQDKDMPGNVITYLIPEWEKYRSMSYDTSTPVHRMTSHAFLALTNYYDSIGYSNMIAAIVKNDKGLYLLEHNIDGTYSLPVFSIPIEEDPLQEINDELLYRMGISCNEITFLERSPTDNASFVLMTDIEDFPYETVEVFSEEGIVGLQSSELIGCSVTNRFASAIRERLLSERFKSQKNDLLEEIMLQ